MNNISKQDDLLNELKKQNKNTTVILKNGFRVEGIIKGFDAFVIFIDTKGKLNMIYKNAISTINLD